MTNLHPHKAEYIWHSDVSASSVRSGLLYYIFKFPISLTSAGSINLWGTSGKMFHRYLERPAQYEGSLEGCWRTAGRTTLFIEGWIKPTNNFKLLILQCQDHFLCCFADLVRIIRYAGMSREIGWKSCHHISPRQKSLGSCKYLQPQISCLPWESNKRPADARLLQTLLRRFAYPPEPMSMEYLKFLTKNLLLVVSAGQQGCSKSNWQIFKPYY